MRVRTLAVLLGLWLVAAPAAAQEQRASIEGTVKDNTGAVLPGVTVDAKNLSQGGVASAVSDAGGFFRFPSLAPGAYEVTAKLSGFTPKTFSRVELTLGQTKVLDMALGVSGLSETVQVTSEQPLIDVKSSQRAYSITADQFVKLPKGRDFSSVVTQAPGANFEAKSNGITIDGATAGENRFIVDGVETTNPQSGMQGKRMVAGLRAGSPGQVVRLRRRVRRLHGRRDQRDLALGQQRLPRRRGALLQQRRHERGRARDAAPGADQLARVRVRHPAEGRQPAASSRASASAAR